MKPSATLFFAWPILPGKEEAWRRAMQEIQEARHHEFTESRRRLGIVRECIRLAQVGRARLAIVAIHANSPGQLLARMAASKHPFDRWFRRQVLEFHGIDLAGSRSAPAAEVILAWQAESALRGGRGKPERSDRDPGPNSRLSNS